MMKIARVFPRITRATPDDDLAFYGPPPRLFPPQVDEVHISVAFTYDLPLAEKLAEQWRPIAPVKIGGPALGLPGGPFVPGMYVKPGYVITSRGCPNRCWFCSVPKREGYKITEFPIMDGWDVLDDNILATSETHFRAVMAMLKRQKERPKFTGGLEAKILQDWQIELLKDLKPHHMIFAYDTPDDWEPLQFACARLRAAGMLSDRVSSTISCFVLIGFPKDTLEDAEIRLRRCVSLRINPYAMLWRDKNGHVDGRWQTFQRRWDFIPRIHAREISEQNPDDMFVGTETILG